MRTTPRFPQSDPGDEQTTLFPDPARCTARGCQAGDRVNLCKHDADQDCDFVDYAPRPHGCIVDFQIPADQPLPF